MITSVISEACERRSSEKRCLNSVTSCRVNVVFRAAGGLRPARLPLHNAPAFREYSHSPDTGTYCIDYVTSQLTVKHNVREYPRVISRAVARSAEGGRVTERVGSSRGVDVGEEGARRLRTHRADGYISRSAGARTRAAPPGLVARLAAGRAPPRATEPRGAAAAFHPDAIKQPSRATHALKARLINLTYTWV